MAHNGANDIYVRALMIIKCPNCQTHYEVAAQAIGSAGRKVQCANCQQSWQARPEPEPSRPKPKLVPDSGYEPSMTTPAMPKSLKSTDEDESDRLFDNDSEMALDVAFEEEADVVRNMVQDVAEKSQKAEKATAEEVSTENADASTVHKQRLKALAARQKKLFGNAPMARLRRFFRMFSLACFVLVTGTGIFMREEIVTQFPDLGGLYASLGLAVNIVGLDFEDVETVRSMRNGSDIMLITAKIRNVSKKSAPVPAILVSVLNENDTLIFQWVARAQTSLLESGEGTLFETQLNAAPLDAVRVRLNFQ